jgi:hypothetical protein
MMRVLVIGLLAALSSFAADNTDWAEVQKLVSGTEIRVHKAGVKKPVVAKLDEVRGDKILIVTGNEQSAILREDIDQLEARPYDAPPRVSAENKATTGSEEALRPRTPVTPRARSGSSSSGITIRSKADFKTIYRRPAK